MGLIDGLHNVPERFKRCCSSLAPPPTNNNNNNNATMFMRVHPKPRAVNGPGNMIFLRELLLCYQQYDEELLSAAVKQRFLSHAASWLNLPNVALRVHSDDPPFPIAAQQSLPLQVPTKGMLWDRKPVKSSFLVESKNVVYAEQQFWKAIDSHNGSYEQYIGKMSTVMEDKKVKRRKITQYRRL